LFFPYLINGVAIGFTFLYFFQPDGMLDTVVKLFGVSADNMPLWLGDRSLINISWLLFRYGGTWVLTL